MTIPTESQLIHQTTIFNILLYDQQIKTDFCLSIFNQMKRFGEEPFIGFGSPMLPRIKNGPTVKINIDLKFYESSSQTNSKVWITN